MTTCYWFYDDPGHSYWSNRYSNSAYDCHRNVDEYIAAVSKYREEEVEQILLNHWETHTPVEVMTVIQNLRTRVSELEQLNEKAKQVGLILKEWFDEQQ